MLSLSKHSVLVETAEQLQTLLQLGCEHHQGYFSGRPMPINALADYLADNTD